MLSLIPVKRELLHGRVEVQKDDKENKGEGTFREKSENTSYTSYRIMSAQYADKNSIHVPAP